MYLDSPLPPTRTHSNPNSGFKNISPNSLKIRIYIVFKLIREVENFTRKNK